MPGITHWQSPRYFAYFATTGAEPGILAELLIAGLNQVGILWRASPALQELEEVTLDWLRQLLGLPEPLHGHLEDTASSGLITALAAARAAAPTGESSSAPSTRTRRRRRPRGCSSSTCGRRRSTTRTPCEPTRSTSPTPARSSRRSGRRRPRRSTRSPPSPSAPPTAGVWLHVDAAYAGAAAVCPELRHTSQGGSAPTRSASTRTSGCSCRWTARPSSRRRPDDLRRAFSLVPEYLRVSEDVVSLSEYASPLGRRFRALKLWAVLRCYGRDGPAGDDPRARPARRLFGSWVTRSRLGAVRAASVLARLLPPRGVTTSATSS